MTDADALQGRLVVANECPRTGYDRVLFPRWTELNGCSTRELVLISESRTSPATNAACDLTAGSWVSAFDGVRTTKASALDVDHL